MTTIDEMKIANRLKAIEIVFNLMNHLTAYPKTTLEIDPSILKFLMDTAANKDFPIEDMPKVLKLIPTN